LFDRQTRTDAGLLPSPEKNCSDTVHILIVGLGNILLKDEGVGVHVAQLMQEEDLPHDVEVIDGGTAGLDVLLSQQPPYKLVVIDAIRAGNKPGTIYTGRFKLTELDRLADVFSTTDLSKISLHQVGLLDALKAAEKLGRIPDQITVIGVEPAEMSLGLELTEPVRQSVPRVAKKVLKEIEDAIYRE